MKIKKEDLEHYLNLVNDFTIKKMHLIKDLQGYQLIDDNGKTYSLVLSKKEMYYTLNTMYNILWSNVLTKRDI